VVTFGRSKIVTEPHPEKQLNPAVTRFGRLKAITDVQPTNAVSAEVKAGKSNNNTELQLLKELSGAVIKLGNEINKAEVHPLKKS
jgi:hypothetical protein